MSRLFGRNSCLVWVLIAPLAACAGYADPCRAAPGDLLYRIPNPDAIPYSEFGDVIAANADTIVIGAPETPGEDEPFVGRAYVFNASDGSLRYTLDSPAPENRQQFGWSAAITDGRVIIGSSGLDGKAYVYTEATGEFERIIENPDERDTSFFSVGVAANGDDLLIASPQHFVGNLQNAGGVYLADAATGDIVHTYENPSPTAFAGFSGRHAIAGNDTHVFAGEPLDPGPDGWTWGSVWRFDRLTGESLGRIFNPSPESVNVPELSDRFGRMIAADTEMLVVGADQDDPGDIEDAGTVYVFDVLTGKLRQTIPNPEPGNGDEFGGAIELVNGDILIGAARDVHNGLSRAGSAYLFDGWTGELLLTLRSPEPEEFDFFGAEVAVAGDRLIVASPADLPVSEVFVFEGMPDRIPGDTNRDGVVDVTDLNNVRNSFGESGYGLAGDADRDALVDILDLNLVRNHFGEGANPVHEPAAWRIALPGALAATASCALLTRNKLDARLTDDYTGKRAMEVRTL